MFEYHLWLHTLPGSKLGFEPLTPEELDVHETTAESDAQIEKLRAAIEDSISRHLTHNTIRILPEGFGDAEIGKVNRSLHYHYTWGGFMLTLNFERNHVPTDIVERQVAFFQDLTRIAPATYGVCHMFSDDEPPFMGRFKVVKLVKGQVVVEDDAFFDQHFPGRE